MASILDKIKQHKIKEVESAKTKRSEKELIASVSDSTRPFVHLLSTKKPAIIAEIKKSSPSLGVIRQNFNVVEIAKAYEDNGAACLSVLTDIDFFHGHPKYLFEAKKHTSLPILRKDFIIDGYQISESRAIGADCILLIAAILDDHQMMDYCQQAQELEMAVLVESHTINELERALKLPTPLMGINNRDLHRFTTSIQTTIELNQIVPQDRIVISESGIQSNADIRTLQSHGIHTFLIGETLMRKDDVGMALKNVLTC